MKVALVSLPVPYADEPAMNPPLGLCCLTSALMLSVADVEIVGIDFACHRCDYQRRDYLQRLPLDADCYAITCVTPQYRWLRDVLCHLMWHAPRAMLVVGGPHATSCPHDCIDAGAHVAVRGDGESVLPLLLADRDYEGPGVFRRGYDGGIAYLDNLDRQPLPDDTAFDVRQYNRRIDGNRALDVITSRGCPFHCAFCDKASPGSRVRCRSVDRVMEEVDELMGLYGVSAFVIRDDIFTLDRNRVLRFCDEFDRRGITWRCWARADTVDRELLKAMRESGMSSITIGIESGDQEVLDRINKGVTVEQNREALMACRELGVPVRCSLVYGNPGECRRSVENTIRLIGETQPGEWNLGILSPVPGSPMWDHPEMYGLSFDKEWLRKNDYLPTNRLGKSGMGTLWVSVDGVTDGELRSNLQTLVGGLERVCPRRMVQDTIQTLRTEKA